MQPIKPAELHMTWSSVVSNGLMLDEEDLEVKAKFIPLWCL